MYFIGPMFLRFLAEKQAPEVYPLVSEPKPSTQVVYFWTSLKLVLNPINAQKVFLYLYINYSL